MPCEATTRFCERGRVGRSELKRGSGSEASGNLQALRQHEI